MLLNSLYQTDSPYILTATFLSDRKSVATYFVQDHVIFRFPADAMVRLATTRTCTEDDMLRNANINYTHCYPSIFATASLTTCAVAMKNALFQAIKISEFGKWVERHDGDHMIHVTSDDVTGDRRVAQPSHVHATESVALATRWCPPGWVKA